MKFKIIKKKGSSLKELGHKEIDIEKVDTLRSLLEAVVKSEIEEISHSAKDLLLEDDISSQTHFEKVMFDASYEHQNIDRQKAIDVMIQDFKDGLFRVFLNGEECLNLDEKIEAHEENELVFIRLVMLAGRLW